MYEFIRLNVQSKRMPDLFEEIDALLANGTSVSHVAEYLQVKGIIKVHPGTLVSFIAAHPESFPRYHSRPFKLAELIEKYKGKRFTPVLVSRQKFIRADHVNAEFIDAVMEFYDAGFDIKTTWQYLDIVGLKSSRQLLTLINKVKQHRSILNSGKET